MKFNETYILELENELLKPETRKSIEKISELLSDDFVEVCSTGEIYRYKIGDTFYKENVSYEITNFDSKQLSDECILTTYKVGKRFEVDKSIKYSFRSSIWKCFNGKWKMIFHQGTLILGSKIAVVGNERSYSQIR